MKARRESRGKLYTFFNLGIKWGWGLTARHGRFTPGSETQHPLYRRLDGPQGESERVRKILPKPGFDSRTAETVDSRYTDFLFT
jgi:hypothetical protein